MTLLGHSFGIKSLIRDILPYGIALRIQRAIRNRNRANLLVRLSTSKAEHDIACFEYEAAIEYLVSNGCDMKQVRQGSMPEPSLDLIRSVLLDIYSGDNPILGLHIGNFLGISLAYLSAVAKKIHSDSFILGLDPNIPHRGIMNPQHYVTNLISHFGLSQHTALLTGYSLEKNASNDGVLYTDQYDPAQNWNSERSCENALLNLNKLAASFDMILIDGNHDETYLVRELDVAYRLLKPDGILILDDVSDGWAGVKGCFHNLKSNYHVISEDGRIGIARKVES